MYCWQLYCLYCSWPGLLQSWDAGSLGGEVGVGLKALVAHGAGVERRKTERTATLHAILSGAVCLC